MRVLNTIIIFFISNLLYSQSELKELLNYIETNQKQLSDFESYEKISDTIVYCNQFNFLDFTYKNTKKSNEDTIFKLHYLNDEIKLIKFKRGNYNYKISIFDYKDYKLWIFLSGDFCLIKDGKVLFFHPDLQLGDNETVKVNGVNEVYLMDSNFNPLRSLELSSGLVLSSSVFKYSKDKTYEKIIIADGNTKKKNCFNVYEKNINSLFLKLNYDFPGICSYFKEFTIELEDHNKSFLWFLIRKQKIDHNINDKY
uniref:hypothetical protein n=1 Tax=Flavobacterium sp. TaxID=239 RepID=UPI004048B5A2